MVLGALLRFLKIGDGQEGTIKKIAAARVNLIAWGLLGNYFSVRGAKNFAGAWQLAPIYRALDLWGGCPNVAPRTNVHSGLNCLQSLFNFKTAAPKGYFTPISRRAEL